MCLGQEESVDAFVDELSCIVPETDHCKEPNFIVFAATMLWPYPVLAAPNLPLSANHTFSWIDLNGMYRFCLQAISLACKHTSKTIQIYPGMR